MLTFLHWQIPVRWHPCYLWTEKQEYTRTIYIVHVHGFLAPKLDWNLTNLGRMCWIPGKPDRKNVWRCFCRWISVDTKDLILSEHRC